VPLSKDDHEVSILITSAGAGGRYLRRAATLKADGMIGTQADKRDASPGAVVHESALAVITTCLAAIAHVHFAAASPQRRTAPLTKEPLPVVLLAIARWFLSNSLHVI